MATIKECEQSLEELKEIWNNGNHKSLPFCRYIKQSLEELGWELVYCNEDIPPELDDKFNEFDEEIYQVWRKLKIERGECSITLMPLGE